MQMKEMTPEQQLAYVTGNISSKEMNGTNIAKKIESITNGQMIEIEQKLRMERESKQDILNNGINSGKPSLQPESNDKIKKTKGRRDVNEEIDE